MDLEVLVWTCKWNEYYEVDVNSAPNTLTLPSANTGTGEEIVVCNTSSFPCTVQVGTLGDYINQYGVSSVVVPSGKVARFTSPGVSGSPIACLLSA